MVQRRADGRPMGGNKVHCSDGYTFDSQKEHYFYHQFVKECGYDFEVHPSFTLEAIQDIPGARVPGDKYTPDFVILDDSGALLHVYDVKNGFGPYSIKDSVKIKVKQFARRFGIPVEIVVVRKHDFRVAVLGISKQLNLTGRGKTPDPLIKTNFDYSWREATNY